MRGGWVGSGVLDKVLKKTDFFDTFPKGHFWVGKKSRFIRLLPHMQTFPNYSFGLLGMNIKEANEP